MTRRKEGPHAKVGKKPWIPTAEDIQKVESLASRGMEQQDIALCLGIGESTLYAKMHEIPDFQEAIKRGKAKGIARVTNALLKNVDTGNVTAQIFYLKCQAKWKDTEEIKNQNEEIRQAIATIKEIAQKCMKPL